MFQVRKSIVLYVTQRKRSSDLPHETHHMLSTFTNDMILDSINSEMEKTTWDSYIGHCNVKTLVFYNTKRLQL